MAAIGAIALLVAPGLASAETKVQIGTPSAGDASYGVAQVRINPRASTRSRKVHGQVFSQNIGGLRVIAQTYGNVRTLRRSVKIHVAVSMVRNAKSTTRYVALFLTRKKGTSTPPARVSFVVPNANAAVGSYTVKKVDRSGFADIFHARNIITMALDNWSKYLTVLKAGKALSAAVKALNINRPDITLAAARKAKPDAVHATSAQDKASAKKKTAKTVQTALWTGGDKLSGSSQQVFNLIFGTIGNRAQYQEAKKNPLVPAFITSELDNKPLADRWTAVVKELPLVIPERYAAAAKEEQRFGASRGTLSVSSHKVVIADDTNSSDVLSNQKPRSLTVNVIGLGKGVVNSLPTNAIFCGDGNFRCVSYFPGGTTLQLVPTPRAGSIFVGWDFCDEVLSDQSCKMNMDRHSSNHEADVNARFQPAQQTLDVNIIGNGFGTVTSTDPAGISCSGRTCTSKVPYGKIIDLTAVPSPGSTFASWEGCGVVTGNVCKVEFDMPRKLKLRFDPVPPNPSGAFANPALINLPFTGGPAAGSLYPSEINVSGMATHITSVKASIQGITNNYPGYIGALLVGPQGQHINLLYLQGGTTPVSDVNLNFDDGAASPVTIMGPLTSGTYKPSTDTSGMYPPDAPSAPHAVGLSSFSGTDPNGVWKLYVQNIHMGDGPISGGWSLDIGAN